MHFLAALLHFDFGPISITFKSSMLMTVRIAFWFQWEFPWLAKLTLADLSVLALLFLIWNSVTFSLLFDGKDFIHLDVNPHMKD